MTDFVEFLGEHPVALIATVVSLATLMGVTYELTILLILKWGRSRK